MKPTRQPIESVNDIVSDLAMYQDDGTPVEIWMTDEQGEESGATGFIVTLGTDFVLIARLFQVSWLNGLRAIRLSAIQEVLPLAQADSAFVLRAMKARNQPIPPEVPFQATTLTELLESLCEHYPVVIVNDDPANRNPSGVAGSILDLKEGVVSFREISKSGDWLEEIRTVAVCHIHHVFFGSQYEETLYLIAELPDQ